jgi:hypothetical protein
MLMCAFSRAVTLHYAYARQSFPCIVMAAPLLFAYHYYCPVAINTLDQACLHAAGAATAQEPLLALPEAAATAAGGRACPAH